LRLSIFRTFVLALLLAGSAALATASIGLAAPPPAAGELLVGFKGAPDGPLVSRLGGTVVRDVGGLGVLHVRAANPDAVARLLRANPAVAFVEPNDRLVRPSGAFDGTAWSSSSWDSSGWDAAAWDSSSWDSSSWDSSAWDSAGWDSSAWDSAGRTAGATMDAAFPVQWGLGAAHFDRAWKLERGNRSVTICVLDTGVDGDHPDLAASLWRQPSGVAGVSKILGRSDPADDVGHGTHVAGIIAAVGGNGIGVAGAARETILSVKVMDATGGREADLAEGITHCARSGAKIATMSLHLDRDSPTVRRAVAHAQSRGMLLVAAAGNDGSTTVRYPAAYPGVVAVGAVGPDGKLAFFSNHGARLDLVAPGVKIASTLWDDKYAMGSGTSQAVPFVAAAAALVWEANPGLSAMQVRATLLDTAHDLGPAGPDPTYGHGALDAYAAVAAARER
jgi:subtilisin family serine protease